MCKPTAGNGGHKKDWYSWSTVYCGAGKSDECYALGDGDAVESEDLVGGWLPKNL